MRDEPGREGFDRRQEEHFRSEVFYLHPTHPTARAFVRPKLDYICRHVRDVDSVLDVGAGNGTFTYHWMRRVPSVAGIERSRRMIESSPCADGILQGDAYALPFEAGSFDLVFESNLLHHVSDPGRVLSEMRRVSRRWVACVEPNRNNPPMLAFSLLVPSERGGLRFTRAHVKRLMEGAGLAPVASRVTGMISQNRTPVWMLPLLGLFDGGVPLGMYTVTIAEKQGAPDATAPGAGGRAPHPLDVRAQRRS